MSFIETAKKISTVKQTENGGTAFTTTGRACLDLFSTLGSMRKISERNIIERFQNAYFEDKELAARMVLYSRDIKEGLGERRTGKILLKELAKIEPSKVIKNFEKITELGRYDDLYVLEGTPCEKEMWKFLKNQFTKDVANYNCGKPISLLPKWLKSVNASSEETKRLGRKTAKMFGISEKTYRKLLSKLRAYENVVEVKMSANDFDLINFESVPAVAMKRYRKAFKKQTPLFEEYLDNVASGKAKINAGTLYPYDLVESYLQTYHQEEDRVVEMMWKSLPNYVEGNHNVVVMADVSGSMYGRPMATSIGLALYFAERNTGAYQNFYLSYTDVPHFISVDPKNSLMDNVFYVRSAGVGYNTNLDGAIKAVYDVAVKEKDVPTALLVISDMEIDYFLHAMPYESIIDKWKCRFECQGLKMPKLIFWNVDSRANFTTLAKETDDVGFCSGASTTTFAHLATLITKTPYEAMVEILMQERYSFNC